MILIRFFSPILQSYKQAQQIWSSQLNKSQFFPNHSALISHPVGFESRMMNLGEACVTLASVSLWSCTETECLNTVCAAQRSHDPLT